MKHSEFLIAVEIQDNGTRTLRPVGRVVRDVVVFDEAVPKGAMARLVAVDPAKLELKP
jgi:hypothetical protein